jgi:hypothetical protein
MYSTTKPDHAFNHISVETQPILKTFFQKLDRHFTAIAHAEAGDLDAVKEILQQNRAMALGKP